jgi:hypothetical protein
MPAPVKKTTAPAAPETSTRDTVFDNLVPVPLPAIQTDNRRTQAIETLRDTHALYTARKAPERDLKALRRAAELLLALDFA